MITKEIHELEHTIALSLLKNISSADIKDHTAYLNTINVYREFLCAIETRKCVFPNEETSDDSGELDKLLNPYEGYISKNKTPTEI